MIEAMKSDEVVRKLGGRFKLTALIQRRWGELLQGERPLIDRKVEMTDLEVIVNEILQDKISVDYEASTFLKPPGREPK